MAAGALLAVYRVSTIAVTGIAMTTGVTTADAQRGRGSWRRGAVVAARWGRGRGRGRGYFARRPVGAIGLVPSAVEQPPGLLRLVSGSTCDQGFATGRESGRCFY